MVVRLLSVAYDGVVASFVHWFLLFGLVGCCVLLCFVAWFVVVRGVPRSVALRVKLLLIVVLSFSSALYLSGFHPLASGVRTDIGDASLFSVLASTHPRILSELRVIEEKPSASLYIGARNVDGIYDPAFGNIFIVDGVVGSGYPAVSTYHHEIGHAVWFRVLTSGERLEWERHYDGDAFRPTEYAASGGVNEDFADSYCLLMIGHEYRLDDWRREFFVRLFSRLNAPRRVVW